MFSVWLDHGWLVTLYTYFNVSLNLDGRKRNEAQKMASVDSPEEGPRSYRSNYIESDPSGETSHRYTGPPLRADTACSGVWHDLAIRIFFPSRTGDRTLELSEY